MDPSVEAAGGCEKSFLRAERVGVLLENDVIIAAIKDIEPCLWIVCVLLKKPAWMCEHGHAAGIAFIVSAALDQKGHVVIVCVAVADKQQIKRLLLGHILSSFAYIDSISLILKTSILSLSSFPLNRSRQSMVSMCSTSGMRFSHVI